MSTIEEAREQAREALEQQTRISQVDATNERGE